MTDLPLASEFPAAGFQEWRALVDGVLKGADFEKRLVSLSRDHIRIEPIYEKARARPQPGRTEHGPWRVAQRVDHPEPDAANVLAVADLEGGADSLVLAFAGARGARGFGIPIATVEALDAALAGVMLELVHLRLDAGYRGREAADLVIALAERRGHALADLALDLALDPIGALATDGRLSAPWEIVAQRCATRLEDLTRRGFSGRAFLADGRPWHEAGASEAQELAAVLATGVAYLRALEAGGHPLEAARSSIAALLVADADEFFTIAKLRALRRLWARIEEACGLAPAPLRIHAESAWRMTARRDPWVNMLRATIATFSAGIGGADSVCVLPFTAALGLPDAFARRVARNTQLILLEESNLWRVADPAAGSGGFEALTEALSEKAWAAFQEIEAEGGIVASLSAGALQTRIGEVRARRDEAIARRKEAITGVSEFPDIREATVAVLMPADEVAGARTGTQAGEEQAGEEQASPLPCRRDAEPFERLRDASDAVLRESGSRPRVFLANLGPLAAFNARSMFARNLFEAGGIEAPANDGFDEDAAMLQAFARSGARIACLCSSDGIYAERAANAARALANAGCARIYLAGRPGEHEAAWREAGIHAFVFVGMDALALLEDAHATSVRSKH